MRSTAERTETVAGDVRGFIIGDVDFAEAVAAFSPLRERLGREVNPAVLEAAGCS